MIARVASLLTAGLGIAAFFILVFAPTGMRCTTAAIGQTGPGQPVVTLGPARCESTSLAEVQSVWWPMPAIALAVWSLAPLLAVVGVWQRSMSLVTVALVLEATSVISFGAGPIYIPLVLLPLAITWMIARRSLRQGSKDTYASEGSLGGEGY